MVGKTVHHYQFLEKLGAGGMGEIWKAQDTRLNRFVAIKILTDASAGDPERRRRFIQEAQAASALNHPNIITIHDIISEGNAEYMVMEYVQGKTLIDLIPKGGLRVPQVLKYAVQMTDALQTAHAAGIIHRDLKPGNVMVTETGLVKVLDFGLAKLTDRSPLSQTGAAGRKRCHANHRRSSAYGGRLHYRHGQLHVARAGPGQARRLAVRYLLPGRGAVRNGHRNAGVCGRFGPLHALGDPAR